MTGRPADWVGVLTNSGERGVHFRSINRQVVSGPMFRRLTTLLALWLGLLCVIAPAVTCAAAASHRDCCPPEGSPPCGECPGKRAPTVPGRTHCVASPVQVSATIVHSRTTGEQGLYPDAPAVIDGLNFRSFSDAYPDSRTSRRSDPAARLAHGTAPPYLVTGRLRL